jgi:phosphoenolpyruvate carboxykinase (GTP)
MRILDWIISRCENAVDAVETPIGFLPKPEDINLEGLDFSKEQLAAILDVEKATWKAEVKDIEQFFTKFGDRMPKELTKQLKGLKSRVRNMK